MDDSPQKNPPPRRPSRLWYVVFLAVIGVIAFLFTRDPGATVLTFSEFEDALEERRVLNTVTVGERTVRGSLQQEGGADPKPFMAVIPPGVDVVPLLRERDVPFEGKRDGDWATLLPLALVALVVFALLAVLMMRSGGGRAAAGLSFRKHRARVIAEKATMVTFKDVAGVDEAVEEVQEIVEYLKDPARFQALGGRVPRGVLLVGMPGTGKTLLARAVAGEASVPFLSISGADFVEMYVGVGAARVRDLFQKAKEIQPCIVFIDELDALGKSRGGGTAGSDEREQTLNQLLVMMDGFSPNAGVIVLAATNRPEILDSALLRAGRFDRRVMIDRPDIRGRLQILRLHTRNIRLGRNVDLAMIARRTPGFTGADLANIVNEAALLAARRRRDMVGMAHFEEAIDRVVAGMERRSRLIGPREKAVVAVHECGHAMMTCLVPRADPLHKVSVIPRGIGAGGMTLQVAREDRTLMTRSELLDRIAVLMGGRVAEAVIFDDLSTGAAHDLRQATDLAYRMVTEYGMSERLGPITVADGKLRFLDSGGRADRIVGDETAREIDLEVRRILSEQEARVRSLLEERKRRLVALARALRDKETMDGTQFQRLMRSPLKVKPKPG